MTPPYHFDLLLTNLAQRFAGRKLMREMELGSRKAVFAMETGGGVVEEMFLAWPGFVTRAIRMREDMSGSRDEWLA
jgi:hypothetical protein